MSPAPRWSRPPVAAWLLLGLALVAHLLMDLHVLLEDDTPAVADRAGYVAHAVRIQARLGLGPDGAASQGAEEPWTPTFRPPLAPALGALALTLLGTHEHTPAAVGMLALVLCAVATLLLGRWLAGPGPALVAALLLLAMPIVVGHSRVLMTDLLLTALTATSTLLLWRAAAHRGSPRRGLALWLGLGLAWGAGLLTKITFPLFVAGPLLLELILGWRRARRRTLSGACLAAGVAALLALPYYGPNLPGILDFYQRTGHISLTMEGMYALSWRSLISHFGALPDVQAGRVLAALGAAALILLAVRRPPGTLRVVVALATPWLLFVPIPLRTARNTMPALPFLALALALAAASLPRQRARRAALLALGLLAPLQFAALHYLPGAGWWFPVLRPPPGAPTHLLLDRAVDHGILRPASVDWWARELTRPIRLRAEGPTRVGLDLAERWLGEDLVQAWALRSARLRLVTLERPRTPKARAEALEQARDLDYLVRVRRPGAAGGSLVESLIRGLGFGLLARRSLPEGGMAELYGRSAGRGR
jgi:4-amino-4-deoxy-L-arabinose transferase-like glycosyltransferase